MLVLMKRAIESCGLVDRLYSTDLVSSVTRCLIYYFRVLEKMRF